MRYIPLPSRVESKMDTQISENIIWCVSRSKEELWGMGIAKAPFHERVSQRIGSELDNKE